MPCPPPRLPQQMRRAIAEGDGLSASEPCLALQPWAEEQPEAKSTPWNPKPTPIMACMHAWRMVMLAGTHQPAGRPGPHAESPNTCSTVQSRTRRAGLRHGPLHTCAGQWARHSVPLRGAITRGACDAIYHGPPSVHNHFACGRNKDLVPMQIWDHQKSIYSVE